MPDARSSYASWHASLAASESQGKIRDGFATWHRMVGGRLGDLAGKRVVEVGCGRGDFAIYMAQNGGLVTAVDFSESAIEIATKRAAEHSVQVDWRVADAQNTGLASASFDLVVSCECLEHVPEPKRMLAELYRILVPGGRCLLTTPSYLNGRLLAWAQSLLFRHPYDSGAGVQPIENFFLYPLVLRMLRKAGFQVREVDSRIFQFLLLPRVDPSRLMVDRFDSPVLNRLFRPFGLHFLYVLAKAPDPQHDRA